MSELGRLHIWSEKISSVAYELRQSAAKVHLPTEIPSLRNELISGQPLCMFHVNTGVHGKHANVQRGCPEMSSVLRERDLKIPKKKLKFTCYYTGKSWGRKGGRFENGQKKLSSFWIAAKTRCRLLCKCRDAMHTRQKTVKLWIWAFWWKNLCILCIFTFYLCDCVHIPKYALTFDC